MVCKQFKVQQDIIYYRKTWTRKTGLAYLACVRTMFIVCKFDPVLFADEESWEAEGLKLDLIEPMKKWSISYEGPMVHQVNKTTHQVKLEVSFTV